MVTVDPTGGDVIDYSDFETQMVRAFAFFEPPFSGADTRGGIIVEHQIEPLEGRGGLGNNEVAELMYLETNAIADILEGENGREIQPSHVDLSGMVGINLTAPQDFVRSSTIDGKSTVVEEVGGATADEIRSPTVTDNDRLQTFEAFAGFGSGDPNGSGQSGYNYTPFNAEKHFRQSHGRGPVLDQNDEISIIAEAATLGTGTSGGTTLFETEVRLTMYWDIAETSDAGRRFSVPRGL